MIWYLCSTFSLFYINSSKLPAGYSNPEKQVYLSIGRVGTALHGTARMFVSADKTGAVGAEAVEKKKKKPARLDSESTGVAGRHLLAASPAHTWSGGSAGRETGV